MGYFTLLLLYANFLLITNCYFPTPISLYADFQSVFNFSKHHHHSPSQHPHLSDPHTSRTSSYKHVCSRQHPTPTSAAKLIPTPYKAADFRYSSSFHHKTHCQMLSCHHKRLHLAAHNHKQIKSKLTHHHSKIPQMH